MTAVREFYYNEQLKNYILQFMALFAGMQVRVGKNPDVGRPDEGALISVPITYASKDRVVAAIKGENTQNKPIRLPMFSSFLSSIDLAPELRKGVTSQRRQTFLKSGGLFPDDIQVVQQRMPVPYRATIDLHIWASNQDQHYQILEQILMLFDPMIQIQTSDELFDWTQLTTVELIGITLEEVMPSGAERRVIQSTLSFQFPIYMSIPTDVHKRYVKDIFMRIGAVSLASKKSEDIVAELDAQGLDYNLIFTLDDITGIS